VIKNRFHKNLAWLIGISTLLRIVLAQSLEFGNDEVYYWTYALFPDWSYFDHPPMLGFFIQLFSLNLLFDSEMFIRLSSIFFAALNTLLFFQIGKEIKNEMAGWYAALLYNASIYTSLIVGVFILPDTPQVFFWLLAMCLMVEVLPDKDIVGSNKRRMLLLGFVIGLGMLSKYTSVFLWIGGGLYISFYNRQWFKTFHLYIGIFISLLFLLPLLYWSMQNNFVNFAFQGERANIFSSSIRFDFVGQEIGGQFFYHNPLLFVLIWISVWAAITKNHFIEKKKLALLLFLSLPMIATFLFISLFRQTLPHWSGPAYLSLMLIAATFLANKQKTKIHWVLKSAFVFLIVLVILAAAETKFGLLNTRKVVSKDLTLDMYGWKQLGEKAHVIFESDIARGMMPENAPIISWRWFPAAHLDYYVGRPIGKNVLAIGSLERIHKYAWINKQRGDFWLGMDAYFITFDTDFEDPQKEIASYFETILAPDTLYLERNKQLVKKAYVYRLKNMIQLPPNRLPKNRFKETI